MNVKRKDDRVMRITNVYRSKRMEGSRTDSERDSGFSDASSEHLSTVDHNDTEDTSRPVVTPGATCPGSQHSQLAVVGGSFPGLSPVIINMSPVMNNVLLKQPGDSRTNLKPWGFGPAVEVVQQPQVVFIQPVVSHRTSAVSKGPPAKRHRHKKYLPILKSYPKIAPHPGDSPSRSSTSSSSSSSSSSLPLKGSGLASGHRERNHKDHQNEYEGCKSTLSLTSPAISLATSPLAHTSLTDSGTGVCPAADCSPLASTSDQVLALSSTPTDTKRQPKAALLAASERWSSNSNARVGSDCSNKQKRFCNTYNILSKSGLLNITLRTKELIRQNRRTQSDLDRLREHTNLFLEALKSGDGHACARLQASMQEEAAEREKASEERSEA
ncbi:CLOCK-interacting pacemaker [Denticeps clupeoides]|uniref:CLOCK-interacting pacemaker n=1 Tax=Denticeps clupeoides TaxID=299321 RepID=A0AAY4BXI5_9TELE|nr:CLOCK-interacting pacemaker-like [Denticeps clupeoides]XP_028858786.1 CLOCK-interacting pacemaker-like [Denticeps clupeoides]XP_028858787.1 CLOCK-interacting pacemaker-like [Denticeps clupeoides]